MTQKWRPNEVTFTTLIDARHATVARRRRRPNEVTFTTLSTLAPRSRPSARGGGASTTEAAVQRRPRVGVGRNWSRGFEFYYGFAANYTYSLQVGPPSHPCSSCPTSRPAKAARKAKAGIWA